MGITFLCWRVLHPHPRWLLCAPVLSLVCMGIGVARVQVIFTNPFLDHPAHIPRQTLQRNLEKTTRGLDKYCNAGDGPHLPFEDLISRLKK